DVFLFVAEDSTVTIERLGAGSSVLPQPAPPTLAASPAAPAPEPRPATEPAAKPAAGIEPEAAPVAAAAAKTEVAPPAPDRPAARPAAARASAAPARTAAARIRVDASQLDDLVGLAGELAVLADNLQSMRDLAGAQSWVHTLEALERVSRQIRD